MNRRERSEVVSSPVYGTHHSSSLSRRSVSLAKKRYVHRDDDSRGPAPSNANSNNNSDISGNVSGENARVDTVGRGRGSSNVGAGGKQLMLTHERTARVRAREERWIDELHGNSDHVGGEGEEEDDASNFMEEMMLERDDGDDGESIFSIDDGGGKFDV